MKRLTAVLLLLAIFVPLVGCGGSPSLEQGPASEAPLTNMEETEGVMVFYDKPELMLTFPEINADSSLVCAMLRRFADNVQRGSNGRIGINVFGGGLAGTEAEAMDMLRQGTVDFIRIPAVNMATRGIQIPEYTAMGLPFLVQSIPGGLEYLHGDSGIALADQILEKSGGQVRSLYSYILTEPRNLYTNGEVSCLADFAGRRIGTEDSRMKTDMINAWATAVPAEQEQISEGLATGALDGCENTLTGYKDSGWQKEAPYVYLTGHSVGVSLFLISEQTWQKLTAQEQTMLLEALQEACRWFQTQQEQALAASIAELKEQGVSFTECTDRQDWIDACAGLYTTYAAGLEDFIADIQSCK